MSPYRGWGVCSAWTCPSSCCWCRGSPAAAAAARPGSCRWRACCPGARPRPARPGSRGWGRGRGRSCSRACRRSGPSPHHILQPLLSSAGPLQHDTLADNLPRIINYDHWELQTWPNFAHVTRHIKNAWHETQPGMNGGCIWSDVSIIRRLVANPPPPSCSPRPDPSNRAAITFHCITSRLVWLWGDSGGAENAGGGSIVTNMVVAGSHQAAAAGTNTTHNPAASHPRGHQGGKLGGLGPVPQPPPNLPLAWAHLGWGVNWAKGGHWPSRGWAELWWSQWWGLDARQLDRGRHTRAGSCVPPQPITAQLCSHLAVSTNHSAALLSSLFTAESPPPAQARLVTPPWQETCALLKYEPSGHLVLWSHKQRFIYKQWTMKLIKVSVGLTSINSNPNQLHNPFRFNNSLQ